MADYSNLLGLLETGATLGSGAISGLVGMPYGLYKGLTSGAYGTSLANRIAEEEARKFMERNTYQPRTQAGQENLRQIAGLLEASKLPPVMPEVSLLGQIPRQAVAAQAERAGMAAERAIEPSVRRTMERGGLPAQLLQDLSQGSRSQIFIGENSKSWNKKAAETAKRLEKEGLSPREIWEQTGTGRNVDGKWRQEVSDLEAKAKFAPDQAELLNAFSQLTYGKPYGALPFGENGLGEQRQLIVNYVNDELAKFGIAKGAIPHKELYKAYPEMSEIPVSTVKDKELAGSYQRTFVNDKLTNEQITANAPTEQELKSALIHELQHGVQQREGFATGGSPYLLQREIDELRDKFEIAKNRYSEATDPIAKDNALQEMSFYGLRLGKKREEIGQTGLEAYKRMAGEAEARLAQTRMNLTPDERLKYYPFEMITEENKYGYDVDPSKLIVRGLLQ